ncbi:MAG: hypothetical protein IJB26_01700 [Clostridia bacterium]|nr:hypothetical protein [Clostridia bacterium]
MAPYLLLKLGRLRLRKRRHGGTHLRIRRMWRRAALCIIPWEKKDEN